LPSDGFAINLTHKPFGLFLSGQLAEVIGNAGKKGG
jgi:hypothetical protein